MAKNKKHSIYFYIFDYFLKTSLDVLCVVLLFFLPLVIIQTIYNKYLFFLGMGFWVLILFLKENAHRQVQVVKAELKMLDIANKYPEIKETYFQKDEEK